MTKSVDPMGVDFRALNVLIRVYELRSFTRAAEELRVNQSAISYTIDKLRAVFNDPLFVRQARSLVPTKRCDDIVRQSQRLVLDFKQLTDPPEFDPTNTSQTFTIACNYYERVLLLPDLLRNLRAEAPSLRIDVIESAWVGHDTLMRNEADLLLGPFFRDDPFFYKRGLFVERSVCLLDPNHPFADEPMTLENYLRSEHVVVTYGGKWRARFIQIVEEMGHELNVVLKVPSQSGLELLVANSNLVATIPERLSWAVGKGLKILPCPIDAQVDIHMAWTAQMHRDPLNKWMREMILRTVAKQEAQRFNKQA